MQTQQKIREKQFFVIVSIIVIIPLFVTASLYILKRKQPQNQPSGNGKLTTFQCGAYNFSIEDQMLEKMYEETNISETRKDELIEKAQKEEVFTEWLSMDYIIFLLKVFYSYPKNVPYFIEKFRKEKIGYQSSENIIEKIVEMIL